jgi:hemolysin III
MEEAKKSMPKEEVYNSLTHFIGALLSVYGAFVLYNMSVSSVTKAATAVFGASLFILFMASAVYHAIINESLKRIFQKIDHSAIYILIAGTYTPILLSVLPYPLSYIMLAVAWGVALIGIIYSCITVKFKYLSTGLYLLMGWMALFLFYSIWHNASHMAMWYLFIGGIFYSLGCVFYLSKKEYMHAIWHLFVIGGAMSHYFCIFEIVKAINTL